ncbi:hypothetical protein CPB83DRAFT_857825 [Crepidotus variabilis]|uniref:Uncharacterized protein n=1 Tax=Crepidotus variabilis TaxID=179855 RepID=A0A9P6EC90_9AGAR|nr:hypothetical protein CPB83DRAFT_857825 [Crepidotus variabilis]
MTRILVQTLFVILTLSISVQAALKKWEAKSFCKCICFGSNNVILPLTSPDNPSQPCLSCTKQWCLNQNLPICAGASLGDTNPDTATGKEGDVEARCFQRDSPRDQLVVTLFLLTVFGLLIGAGIKNRMLKAGMVGSIFPWSRRENTEVRWWEPWIPQREESDAPLGLAVFGRSATFREGREGYSQVQER